MGDMAGGARTGAGRRPEQDALRRDRKDDPSWTRLPAEGRAGDPPAWPLVGHSSREAALWAEFWAKPQAILWEAQRQAHEVAVHVRTFAEAEVPGASTALRTLLRQQADALLLTIPAMRGARVTIASDEVGAKRSERQAPERPGRASARDRLKAAQGG